MSKAKPFVDTWSTGTFLQNTSSASFLNARLLNNSYTITDRWLTALNDSKRVLAAFMDFNKAFDRVWHPGLLLKLGNCGLQPNALRWLSDYLSERKLVVRVDSTLSSPQLITAGVPQGSHLGPVLFTVFINDLPSAVRVPTELYADDALLHQVFSRSHPLDDVAVFQASLSAASSWATCWNGRFSPEKTVLMEIKPSNSASTPLSPVLLEGQPVNILVHHKHLGITFQSDLSWSAHLEKLISKGTQRAGLLKLMSRTLPLGCCRQTIPSLCSSSPRICQSPLAQRDTSHYSPRDGAHPSQHSTHCPAGRLDDSERPAA